MTNPFKGRISITTDVNGKKSVLDKEFSSEKEFNEFARGQSFGLMNPFSMLDEIEKSFSNFNGFGSAFLKGFGLPKFLGSSGYEDTSETIADGDVLKDKYGLDKYDKALEESRVQKREQEKKMNTVKELESVIDTLKSYKEKFIKEKNDAMLVSVDSDIAKYETRKKSLEAELSGN